MAQFVLTISWIVFVIGAVVIEFARINSAPALVIWVGGTLLIGFLGYQLIRRIWKE